MIRNRINVEKVSKKAQEILDKIEEIKEEWRLFDDLESKFIPDRMKGGWWIWGKEVTFNISKQFLVRV